MDKCDSLLCEIAHKYFYATVYVFSQTEGTRRTMHGAYKHLPQGKCTILRNNNYRTMSQSNLLGSTFGELSQTN